MGEEGGLSEDNGMIDRFWDYIERNHKLAVGTLAALLLVGSVGGGLWIHALEVRIETVQTELDESSKQIEAVKQQFDAATVADKARMDLELQKIDLQISDLKLKVSDRLKELQNTIADLNRLVNSGRFDTAKRQKLSDDVSQLQAAAKQLQQIQSSEAYDIRTARLTSEEVEEFPIRPVRNPFLAILLWGLCFVIVTGSIFFLGYRAGRSAEKSNAVQTA